MRVQAPQTQDEPLRVTTFFANPEWMPPTAKPKTATAPPNTAVAGGTQPGVAAVADAVEGGTQPGVAAVADADEVTWEYTPIGQTTMHPFWAVRRLTELQMDKEIMRCKAEADATVMLPRFNCAIEYHQFNSVSVGVVNKDALNITRMCSVPFLTNALKIEKTRS